MWRNYMTVGIRALTKNKTYAFINIVGLAIGLAACLLLLVYVRYETNYDSWLPNHENTYQLQTRYTEKSTGQTLNLQMASYVSGQRLKENFPQIESMVYASAGAFTVLRNGEAVTVENTSAVNGPFFDTVQLPMLHGDPATALQNPGSVALNETTARRLFGTDNPVGRTLTTMIRGRQVDQRVTAVFRDLPRNSHMDFNMLVRIDPNSYYAEQPEFMRNWGWQSGWYYLRLRPGTDPAAINAAIPAWERRVIPTQVIDGISYNPGDESDYRIENVRSIHLGEAQNGAARPGNDWTTITTFLIVAFLILGMACVNFTNLATARASQRAREVALRKVLGANRRQLITQFLGESVLIACISMLLALAMVELLLPLFSGFLDADLRMQYLGWDGMLLPVLGLTLLVGAAGGLYPAFYLSRFQPAQVLKANKSSSEASGSGLLRNILVVGQFAVSIGLIICTAVVYAQTVYAQTADPGYRRDGILQVEGIGRRQIVPIQETLIREIERVPGVQSAARTTIGVATQNSTNEGVLLPGRSDPINIGSYQVDYKFFDTMGIRLLAGRAFDQNRPMDDATVPFPTDPAAQRAIIARGGVNVVINESAARKLGWRNPAEAVGKQVRAGIFGQEYGLVPVNIIGVVQDSRFRSIREPLDEIMFRINRTGGNVLDVRLDPGADPRAVLAGVEAVWKRLIQDAPFSARFSEDIITELYTAETARAKVFAGFAILAVIVACLGLFGLAAFTAERRTKEIGIRKVLGARVRDIVGLLAWQFSKPVLWAMPIAWLIAWWQMSVWLNTFDTRIDMGVLPFVAAGLLALVIAVGTIASHAFRVARANPILALRYE
ncbi:MAG TPA: ABC transporter permease [Allosphingosinicella sp.]|nr:ABC transporter permease [Allosphingosinicella sp.]